MIRLNCEQGSPAWVQCRLGIPTASNFDQIVTPGGKPSASATKYMHELLAEWVFGKEQEDFAGNYWTDRGKDLESEARSYYELQRDVSAEKVGFVYRDEDRLVGCSPDWLVGTKGQAEVKCPSAKVHISYLLAGSPQYTVQVQGQLWVTKRAWSDFVSYCPGLPPLVIRCEPEPKMQALLDQLLPDFIERMMEARKQLVSMGVEPVQPVDVAAVAARLSAEFAALEEEENAA